MRILIVAATHAEIRLLAKETGCDVETSGPPFHLHTGQTRFHAHDIHLLVTGVGMVATAARCADALAAHSYDVALNVGICGSFDTLLSPGSTVHVVSDCIAELGAEDGDRFITVQELQLLDADEFPFRGGRLVNDAPPANAALQALPAVRGITVNTVHGHERSIDAVVRRFQPQIESMEGAAFMYACLLRKVPFAQIRAVSNVVERRNRGAWKITEAIDNLNRTALEIINHL